MRHTHSQPAERLHLLGLAHLGFGPVPLAQVLDIGCEADHLTRLVSHRGHLDPRREGAAVPAQSSRFVHHPSPLDCHLDPLRHQGPLIRHREDLERLSCELVRGVTMHRGKCGIDQLEGLIGHRADGDAPAGVLEDVSPPGAQCLGPHPLGQFVAHRLEKPCVCHAQRHPVGEVLHQCEFRRPQPPSPGRLQKGQRTQYFAARHKGYREQRLGCQLAPGLALFGRVAEPLPV